MQSRSYGSIVLLLLLVALPLTYFVPYADYILIATILAISLPTLCLVTANWNTIDKDMKTVFVAFGAYFLWMILMLGNSRLVLGTVARIIQMLGCIFAFVCGSMIKFKEPQLRFVRGIVQAILLINVADWVMSGMPMRNYSFIVSSTTAYGTILLSWIIFLSIFRKKTLKDWIFLLTGGLLLFFSSTRSALIAVAAFAVVSLFMSLYLNRKEYRKKVLNKVLIGTIVGCVLFIFIYAEAGDSEVGIRLNEMSIKYFGKRLFSGRQIIWSELIGAIKEKPIIGYGLNVIPSDICNTSFSAHNTFLQVASQSGIVGLLFLMCVLLKISQKVINNNDIWYSIVGVACVISIIIHECFEACLVQNMLVLGLQMWLLMGLVTNKTVTENNLSNSCVAYNHPSCGFDSTQV